MKLVFLLTIALVGFSTSQERGWKPEEETAEFWIKNSEEELKNAVEKEKLNTNVAKNVIFFLGDGMSIATVTAGRIMKGQLQNRSGEETRLAVDQFPHVGLSKTYSVDYQVSDSATTASAYLTGTKANYGTIGVSARVNRGDWQAVEGNEVQSVLMDSYEQGKSTGIVSTAHITHASPAGTYAHTADRNYYADDDLPDGAKEAGYKDIATQFIDSSDKITVAMGGGRKYFTMAGQADVEYPDQEGNRGDVNLVDAWLDKHKDVAAEYVWNKEQFDAVDPIKTDKLLGLFERSHMQYEVDRPYDEAGEPSLTEMTEKAIKMLQKNSKGYFLFVEGGRIDHAHHANNGYRALTELVQFDEAIQRAVDLTAESDTLIVVTADHSHTLTVGGYSDRGNPITGLAPTHEDPDIANDGKPYTTLLYGTGPGWQGDLEDSRDDLAGVDIFDKEYIQQSAVPKDSATHAGEDVMIFARGPMSHLYHGVHEQSYIPHVVRYASCVGDNTDHCAREQQTEDFQGNEDFVEKSRASFLGFSLDNEHAAVALYAQFYILLTTVFLILLSCCKASKCNNRSSDQSSSVGSFELKVGKNNESFASI